MAYGQRGYPKSIQPPVIQDGFFGGDEQSGAGSRP